MIEDSSSRFSPSKLSTYRECPQRYKFRYIDGLKRTGQTVEQFLGTCVHSAFEALHEGLQQGRRLDEAQAQAVFEAEWEKGAGALLPGPAGPANKEEWKQVGRDCVRNYYRQWAPFDRDRTVAVERQVGFPLVVEGKEYQLQGYIDRLALSNDDDALEIHDYKTAKTLPAQDYVDQDWQLALYEIAVRHLWPDTKAVRLKWHYVRHGKTLTSTRTAEQLAALKAQAVALVDAIKRDREFPPRESALCGWCEFKTLCPLFSHADAVQKLPPELRSSDEGRQAVDALEELEQRKRALRADVRAIEQQQEALEAQLLSYAQKHGYKAVSGTHSDAALASKESYKFPTKTGDAPKFEALENELRATPLWAAVSHFDAHRFLDAWKSAQWPKDWAAIAESVLGRYAQRVIETTLRLRRRRDAED